MAIKNKGKILTFGAISTFLLAFNNCGRPMEAIDSAAKSDFLKKSSVLNVPKSVVSMQAVNGEEPITPPVEGEQPVVTTPATGSGATSVPVKLICSNAETSNFGVNVVQTESISVEITQYAVQEDLQLKEISRCTDNSSSLKTDLMNTKQLVLKKCVAEGALVSAKAIYNDVGDLKLTTVGSLAYSVVVKAANGTVLNSNRGDDDDLQQSDKVGVLFDVNTQASRSRTPAAQQFAFGNSTSQNGESPATTTGSGGTSTAETQEKCDQRASPLFVDLRTEEQMSDMFLLSAPWEGVVFDILGKNADPVAHAKNRISWFKNKGLAFITLPNKKGQVKGIDELFGDNTFGPDGKFAENGYAALAKYDDNKDHLIDAKDAVFSKLRIWVDGNLDGVAQQRDLITMQQAGLTVIDLNYDKNYSETDVYGNEIKYKSVAKTADGEMRLVFDVWFELNLHKAKKSFQQSQLKLSQK
jgi:hypothetical protein